MKRLLFALVLITMETFLLSQTPATFNYQAILRNFDGSVKANERISLQINIVNDQDVSIYLETQNTQTTELGLINIAIGQGETSDDLSSIDWTNGPYFFDLKIDGISMGSSPILSVPFAMHSNKTNELTGGISGAIDIDDYTDNGEVVPIIVGDSFRIYGNELANVPITNTLAMTYVCAIGKQVGNDFIINANSENIGNIPLYIQATNDGVIIRKTKSILSIKDKVNTGSKSITLIGNSLTKSGGALELAQLRSIFDNMTWTAIGTTGMTPDLREGHSGKTYDWLVNSELSPFTKNEAVDIPAYYADNGLSVPDYIYMRMGVNSAYSEATHNDHIWSEAAQDLWISYIDELVDSFLAHDSGVEIIIGLPSISEDTGDGWEANYPGNIYQDEYIGIIHQMRNLILAKYDSNKYNARVSVAYAPWFLDRNNGYPKIDGVHTNGVHPINTGYTQLGRGLAFAINKLL